MKPPHIKAIRKKEVRQITKRRAILYRKLWDLGFEKLEEPIRHGWYRELIITKEVQLYKKADAILELYEMITRCYWGATKEKAQKQWDNNSSLYMIAKDKPTISKKQYNRLSDAAQKFCTVFRYRSIFGKTKTRFYVNFPKGCMKFQFTRAYITHRKIIDPEMISELKFLESKLNSRNYYDVYKGMDGWDTWGASQMAYETQKRERKQKKNIRMLKKESVQDLIKDKVLWEIN